MATGLSQQLAVDSKRRVDRTRTREARDKTAKDEYVAVPQNFHRAGPSRGNCETIRAKTGIHAAARQRNALPETGRRLWNVLRPELSGTSMATPNVVNLAAKLFALDPSLTPPRVIELIKQGATTSDDGWRHLIDEKRSVALLAARTPR